MWSPGGTNNTCNHWHFYFQSFIITLFSLTDFRLQNSPQYLFNSDREEIKPNNVGAVAVTRKKLPVFFGK